MTTDTTSNIILHSLVIVIGLLSAALIYTGAMVGCLNECVIFASICSVVGWSILYSVSRETPL